METLKITVQTAAWRLPTSTAVNKCCWACKKLIGSKHQKTNQQRPSECPDRTDSFTVSDFQCDLQ